MCLFVPVCVLRVFVVSLCVDVFRFFMCSAVWLSLFVVGALFVCVCVCVLIGFSV